MDMALNQNSQPQWLTQTKFISPRLRDDIVPRPRLLESLHTAIQSHTLTLVSAPAGYGKTTLLTSLVASSSEVSVAWISLDEDDNDPARFLAALSGALQRTNPAFANLRTLLANFIDPANDARRVIGAIINETLAHTGEIWVVLDDLHVITEPVLFSAFDYWLERMPPQMHLLIATRHDPPLVLARLRARGQLAEVRAPNLRFTADEASDFLNEKQGLCLSADDLAQLQARTEGWAAGLRLLASSLDQMSSTTGRTMFLQNLARTDRHVFEFLADEVLKRQDPQTRAFLLETSILPELTPKLCCAVTGRDDAQTFLEDLARRNLFLTQVDERGISFRYHALFAEFLQAQLQREMPRIAELHRRAADAQKKTSPTRAMAHYLAAEAWDDAAQTIESVSEEYLHQGLFRTLHGWIESLPASFRAAHPRLSYLLGFCALQRGEPHDAMTFLESARCAFQANDDAPGQGETLLLMIDAANRLHDYPRQAELTQEALKFPLSVHGQVMLLLARVWEAIYQNNPKQADAELDRALELTLASNEARTFNAVAPILNMHLAHLPSGPARLEHYNRQVLMQFGEQVSFSQACALSLQSYLAFLKGAVAESAREAEQAGEAFRKVGGFAYTEGQARSVLGMCAAVRGNYREIEELWAHALPEMEQAPLMHPFLVAVHYLIGRAQWMQGKIEQARQADVRISAIVQPDEFPEVTTARKLMRALIEIADRQFDNAERTLQQAVAIEKKYRHAIIFGCPSVLLAYLHLQCKREKEAWAQFAPFLAECEQRDMPGLILQETKTAIPLLRLAIEKKSHADFAKRLLDTLDATDQAKPVLVPDTGETLTPREFETLKLIAGGASNQAIAKQLVISEHTVKVHVTNILGKLRASSRTQAAARARELRLL